MPENSSISGGVSVGQREGHGDLTRRSVLEGESHHISESLKSWWLGVDRTHLATEPFCNDNLDATVALTSVPMTLLENFRVKYWESQWLGLASTF